mgnify:CR=1 FL=1
MEQIKEFEKLLQSHLIEKTKGKVKPNISRASPTLSLFYDFNSLKKATDSRVFQHTIAVAPQICTASYRKFPVNTKPFVLSKIPTEMTPHNPQQPCI